MDRCSYPTTTTGKPCGNPVAPSSTRCAAGHPVSRAGGNLRAEPHSPASGALDLDEIIAGARWPAGIEQSAVWPGEGGITGGRPFRYEAHVPPPIAPLPLYLSGPTADAVAEAQRAIEHLESGDGSRITQALATPLLRVESLSSSRIEGLMVSHRTLAVALADPSSASVVAREVANSVTATAAAITLFVNEGVLRPTVFSEVHQMLARGTVLGDIAGEVRTKQNWIGKSDRSPRKAAYVPPPPEHVPGLLADLAAFSDRQDLPPLAVAAIAHAQFETIHPFGDGNGRVGRAIIHGILRRHGATQRFAPPVSGALLASTDAYVSGLVAYRNGDVDRWLRLFATEMTRASAAAERLGSSLAKLEDAWMERARRPRAHSVANLAIHRLVEFPVVDVSALASHLRVDAETARRGMNALEASGIVRQVSAGRRNRVWIAEEAFALLDGFDELLAQGTTPRRHPTRGRRR